LTVKLIRGFKKQLPLETKAAIDALLMTLKKSVHPKNPNLIIPSTRSKIRASRPFVSKCWRSGLRRP